MFIKSTVGLLVALAAFGCNKDNAKETTISNPDPAAEQLPADNTGKNARDEASAKTAGDQSESETDRTITQHIRQAVVGDDKVSLNGKNVKIITVDGVVTLRGPVDSEQERTGIGSLAKGIDGVKKIDNQLEVAAK